MGDHFPHGDIDFLVQAQLVPVRELVSKLHQEVELRQGDQRESRSQRDGNALQTDLQPLLRVIALVEHVGEIAGNDKEHLHPEGVNKVIKYGQSIRRHSTVYCPDMAGVNQ